MPTANAVAPAQQPTEPAPTAGFDGSGDAAQGSDNPSTFDKEPFDAGVEADEESDPKKYIEQLTGKLGQSLRSFEETNGIDFELEKFAINSILSATHTSEMDDNDRADIIKKVNTAGDNDESSEVSDIDGSNSNPDSNNGNNDGGNDEFGDFSQSSNNNNEEGLEETEAQIFETEDLFLKEPVRCDMFQPGSFDALKKRTGKDLNESNKSSIFGKINIKQKLHESLNQEDSMTRLETSPAEPEVKPAVKPSTVPAPTPTRRNKPFLPMPEVEPDPKASSKL